MRLLQIFLFSFITFLTNAASTDDNIPESVRKAIEQAEIIVTVDANGQQLDVLAIADTIGVDSAPQTTSNVLLNAYTLPANASGFGIKLNGRYYRGKSTMYDPDTGATVLEFTGATFYSAKKPKIFSHMSPGEEYIISSITSNGQRQFQIARMLGFQNGRSFLSELKASSPVRGGNVFNMNGEWVGFVQQHGVPSQDHVYVVDKFSIDEFKIAFLQLSAIWFQSDSEFKKNDFNDFVNWARKTAWTNEKSIFDLLADDQGFLSRERDAKHVAALATGIRSRYLAHIAEVAKHQFHLDCILQPRHGNRQAFEIHVKLIEKTANGWPAVIDDSKIRFATSEGKTGVTVNRYTGTISIDVLVSEGLLTKGENLATGNCQPRAKDRKF